jgi:hypothetical protein
MNETEWLNASDPEAMLAFLGGDVSQRKLRLFACACCRRIWDLLADERSRNAVDVAQRFADGQLSGRQLRAGERAALSASKKAADAYWDSSTDRGWQQWTAAAAAAWVAAADPEGPLETAEAAADARAGQWRPAGIKAAEKKAQCAMLRDLVGNPFRPVVIEPSWLIQAGGTMTKIARTIYDQGRFQDLPMLAEALGDVRCTSPEILSHCGSQAGHVRGCWLVDAILGKI